MGCRVACTRLKTLHLSYILNFIKLKVARLAGLHENSTLVSYQFKASNFRDMLGTTWTNWTFMSCIRNKAGNTGQDGGVINS